MELHIEPQQPNLANGEKSAAQERKAFDFKTHTKKKALKGRAHTLTFTYQNKHTHTHMHMDHAPRHSSHADTVAVPLWHKNQAWHAIWSWEEGLLEGC